MFYYLQQNSQAINNELERVLVSNRTFSARILQDLESFQLHVFLLKLIILIPITSRARFSQTPPSQPHHDPLLAQNKPSIMSHARIEEVSDSDPSEGNISDVSSEFDEREILKAREKPQPRASSSLLNPSSIPSTTNTNSPSFSGAQFHTTQDESKYKDFQCLYPVYFDVNRSRTEGRRVGKELAVENPMAREIVNACARLRLETLFEPSKIHPKDWANPGRVKIKLKGGGNSSIKNSELTSLCCASKSSRECACSAGSKIGGLGENQ